MFCSKKLVLEKGGENRNGEMEAIERRIKMEMGGGGG